MFTFSITGNTHTTCLLHMTFLYPTNGRSTLTLKHEAPNDPINRVLNTVGLFDEAHLIVSQPVVLA